MDAVATVCSTTALDAKALLDIATPDLYRQNAFRVLNLPTTATASDLARQHKRLKLMQKLGENDATPELACLQLDEAPDSEAIRSATQRLQDPVSRLIDELFWFWPVDPQSSDDDALRLLRAKDITAAAALWAHRAKDRTNGYIAIHNLAVLNHALALDIEHAVTSEQLGEGTSQWRHERWIQALENWRAAIEHDDLWSHVTARIRELDDPRLTTGFARRIRFALPGAILTINARIAVQSARAGRTADAKRHVSYIRDCGIDRIGWAEGTDLHVERITPAAIVARELSPLLEEVRIACESAANGVKSALLRTPEILKGLIAELNPVLGTIDALSELDGTSDLRELAHDQAGETIRNCAVSFGTETGNWMESLNLTRTAQQFACAGPLRAQLEQDIAQLGKLIADQREQSRLKDAVTAHQVSEVTIPRGGATVWQVCTCCLGKPDSEQTVSYSWEEWRGLSRNTRQLSFAFPICTSCLRHWREYELKRWALFLVPITTSTLIMWLTATIIEQPHPLMFLTGGTVLNAILLFAASRFLKVGVITSDHACRRRAVAMSCASNELVTFRFKNPLYADAFARANKATVTTRRWWKPPRGSNLLEGRGGSLLIAGCLTIAAVAHLIVYGSMQDSWQASAARHAASANPPARNAPAPIAVPSYRYSGLENQISAGKSRLTELEADIGRMDAQLQSWSSEMGRYKIEIQGYERAARNGFRINESAYEQILAGHNRDVDDYNALLEQRREKYETYTNEINALNDLVRRYNQGER